MGHPIGTPIRILIIKIVAASCKNAALTTIRSLAFCWLTPWSRAKGSQNMRRRPNRPLFRFPDPRQSGSFASSHVDFLVPFSPTKRQTRLEILSAFSDAMAGILEGVLVSLGHTLARKLRSETFLSRIISAKSQDPLLHLCARCNKDRYQTTDAIRMGGGRNPQTLEEFFRESAEFFVTGGQ